jgi:hypothetical protein
MSFTNGPVRLQSVWESPPLMLLLATRTTTTWETLEPLKQARVPVFRHGTSRFQGKEALLKNTLPWPSFLSILAHVVYALQTITVLAISQTTCYLVRTPSIPAWARPLSRSAAALSVLLFFLTLTVLATTENTRCSTKQPPSVDGSATLVLPQSTVSLAWFWLAP